MLTLLLFFFATLLSISFGIAFLLLRTPAEQKAMQQRLEALVPAESTGQQNLALDSLLKPASGNTKSFVSRLGRTKLLIALQLLIYQSKGHRRLLPTLFSSLALAVVTVVVLNALTAMLPIAMMAGVISGAMPLLRLVQLRRKRLKLFEAALPDAIDLCTRALHAGYSLIAAIGLVSEQGTEPVRSEFAEIFKKQNYGLPLRDALLESLERVPSADLRIFAAGILVQKDTGGNLTEIFDRIVHVIRERNRIAGEIRVHTAQGRMTAWILTLLPPTLLLVINVINPGYSTVLFHDPTGRTLLYTGVVLLFIGGIVVRRIVNGIEV